MSQREQITAFIEMLTHYDGVAPFSDAKLPIDTDSGRVVVVAENDGIMAIGASATHTQSDGSIHKELETALRPVMRFLAFEGAVLDASLPLVDRAGSFSVWSQRSSLDAALYERGFKPARVLDFLVIDLPLTDNGATSVDRGIRPFLADDVEGLAIVNRAAFEGHREAAALDATEVNRYRSESWFDEEGLLVAESDGVAGFCWTKVHPDGDGEIFRIAVDPAQQGTGLGMALLHAGFDHLAGRPDVSRGVLWVDRANTIATGLYLSLGMKQERSNTEFVLE
jgi:mycothiol synthase